jgi:nicotinamide-nucleotide amidase
MEAEIINTGSELLLGDVVNTHGAYLGRALADEGIVVGRQVAVGDGEVIGAALAEAFGRAGLVLVTGGLGPTEDDLSREMLARLLGLPLELDAGVLRSLEAFFRERGREVGEKNLRQAMVPRGCEVLENPRGTAPGLFVPADVAGAGSNPPTFLLPGPRGELVGVWEEQALPRLRGLGLGDGLGTGYFHFFGVGESEVAEALDPGLAELGVGGEVGYCLRAGGIDVRARGVQGWLEGVGRVCVTRMGDKLAYEGRRGLEDVVVELCGQRGLTVATAESCTGGMVAERLTAVAGASAVFLRGYVSYANRAKVEDLGVDEGLIAAHGAVSGEVAAAMAEGCRARAGSDLAVSVTGVAGPGGGTESKPVGTVWLGLAWEGGVEVVGKRFRGDRERVRVLATGTALEMLLRKARGGG